MDEAVYVTGLITFWLSYYTCLFIMHHAFKISPDFACTHTLTWHRHAHSFAHLAHPIIAQAHSPAHFVLPTITRACMHDDKRPSAFTCLYCPPCHCTSKRAHPYPCSLLPTLAHLATTLFCKRMHMHAHSLAHCHPRAHVHTHPPHATYITDLLANISCAKSDIVRILTH